jgi:hypothetical protein
LLSRHSATWASPPVTYITFFAVLIYSSEQTIPPAWSHSLWTSIWTFLHLADVTSFHSLKNKIYFQFFSNYYYFPKWY